MVCQRKCMIVSILRLRPLECLDIKERIQHSMVLDIYHVHMYVRPCPMYIWNIFEYTSPFNQNNIKWLRLAGWLVMWNSCWVKLMASQICLLVSSWWATQIRLVVQSWNELINPYLATRMADEKKWNGLRNGQYTQAYVSKRITASKNLTRSPFSGRMMLLRQSKQGMETFTYWPI